jgi:hypothetical protein
MSEETSSPYDIRNRSTRKLTQKYRESLESQESQESNSSVASAPGRPSVEKKRARTLTDNTGFDGDGDTRDRSESDCDTIMLDENMLDNFPESTIERRRILPSDDEEDDEESDAHMDDSGTDTILTGTKRKRREGGEDLDEYVEDYVVNLDFSKHLNSQDGQLPAPKKRRTPITTTDHAHPVLFAGADKKLRPSCSSPLRKASPATPEQQEISVLGHSSMRTRVPYTDQKPPRQHQLTAMGGRLIVPSWRPTLGQLNSSPQPDTSAVQSRDKPFFPMFTFSEHSFVEVTHQGMQNWVALTSGPISLEMRRAVRLPDSHEGWKDSSQGTQDPVVAGRLTHIPNGVGGGKTPQKQFNSHSQRDPALAVRSSDPQHEHGHRVDDVRFDHCCTRDEDAQRQTAIRFADPFREVNDYYRANHSNDGLGTDIYSLPMGAPRGAHPPDEVDNGETRDGEPSKTVTMAKESENECLASSGNVGDGQEAGMRGGDLPEPQGEHGLDRRDLAAVNTFVNSNPRTNGQIIESERELVNVSKHVSIGDDRYDACWCAGMQHIERSSLW